MLSPENQLLVFSTRLDISATSRQIADLIEQSPDWDEIMSAASWYAVKPLLYRSLRDNPASEKVPAEVMHELKKSYDDITVRNMYIYAILTRIMPLFERLGIQCIVLKGALLADEVYGDIGLRPMQDIDLLFRKEDLDKVIAIFTDLGYHHEGSKDPQLYLDTHHHITYTQPEMDIPVEIHWHITHDRHPQRLRLTDEVLIEQWFQRKRPVTLSRVDAWSLCPTDLIFHLCLHFLKHRVPTHGGLFVTSAAWLQLTDLARVIRHYGDAIDWNDLRQQADKYRITDLIHSTINIALDVCPSNDSNSRQFLDDAEGRYKFEQLMYKRLVKHDDMNKAIPEEILNTVNIDNLRGIVRAVLRWLLPAKETLAERYSVPVTAKRVYIYYLLNPFNLIRTVLLFVEQIPRLSDEIRLNKWIGGRYLPDID